MPYVQSIVLSNPSDQNDIEITDVNTLPPFHSTKFSKKVRIISNTFFFNIFDL